MSKLIHGDCFKNMAGDYSKRDRDGTVALMPDTFPSRSSYSRDSSMISYSKAPTHRSCVTLLVLPLRRKVS